MTLRKFSSKFTNAAFKKASWECYLHSQIGKRIGKATPIKNKMLQSEFFYWEYPYKQTQTIDFHEMQK